jgi:hypothetical protein
MKAPLCVFVLALSVRLAVLAAAVSLTCPDSYAYLELGSAIRSGQPYLSNVLAGPGGFPADLQRPPGYPLWVAITGNAAPFLQCVLGAALAIGLYAAARRFFGETAGIVAGIAYATDWATIVHTPLFLADHVFAVLVAVAVIATIEARTAWQAAAVGILVAATALTRPSGLLLVPPLAASLWWRLRWQATIYIAAAAICIAPWAARNYHQHGLFALSAIDAVVLRFYTAEGAAGGLDDIAGRVRRLDAEWGQRQLAPVERRKAMNDEALALIAAHPVAAAAQAFLGLLRTCFGTARETAGEMLGRSLPWVVNTLLPLAPILILWALAAAGIQRKPIPLLLAAVTLLFLLSAASPLGYSRFRVHVVPLICLLVGSSAQRAAKVVAAD